MAALVIDAFEFCRLKELREGETPVSGFPRLSLESAEKSGVLQWSLKGEAGPHGHPQMTVSVSGMVSLICQRCLKPFEYQVAAGSAVVLAKDEASADEIEALLDDDAVDVIVGSTMLDVMALIEDEVLLALPLSPKHAVCPPQDIPMLAKIADKESPFSILKNLRGKE